MRLPPSSPIGESHVDKQLGVGKLLPGQGLQRYVSVARLKTLQRDGILTCGSREIKFNFKALSKEYEKPDPLTHKSLLNSFTVI